MVNKKFPSATTYHQPVKLPFARKFRHEVEYCDRCGHITEFPVTKINHNLFKRMRSSQYGFRIIERKSWETTTMSGRCGGTLKEPRIRTKREDMDSCSNCRNNRGHGCYKDWTADRCDYIHCQPSPFTICDLHNKRVEWSSEQKKFVVVGDYTRRG